MKLTLPLLLFASALSCPAQNPYYVREFGPGVHAIANHFDQGRNTLNEVLPSVPAGSKLYKWNPETEKIAPAAQFIPCLGWVPPLTTLRPGEGAFLELREPAVIFFQGHPHSPSIRLDAVLGYNFVSCQSARPCSFEEVFGFLPKPGDRVFEFDAPLSAPPKDFKSAASRVSTFGPNGWDTTPKFDVGRSVAVWLSGFPHIIQQPATQHVVPGGTAIFRVRALGTSPLSYQWRRGELIIPDATDDTLVLQRVTANHSGTYSVIVSNRDGVSWSLPATLFVSSAPFITSHPSDLTVREGENPTFRVKAIGTTPLFYTWYYRYQTGQPIVVGTGPSLTISNAAPGQSGLYEVVVTNRFGSDGGRAFLEVVSAPRIIRQPEDQIVPLGQNAIFRAAATGSPPLRFQWRKNGVNIPGATDNVFSILKVIPADGGIYDVVAYNPYGAVSSDPAALRFSPNDLPELFFANDFRDRRILDIPSGIAMGDNLKADREPGEPSHAGKRGGSSVWIRWFAPSDGIATFDTAGSSFDTLLAAYDEGNELPLLNEKASDDDHGDAHTSRISFNTTKGRFYEIAIDGFNGERGDIVLEWRFMATNETLPEIETQPVSQSVARGTDAIFTVKTRGTDVGFEWIFKSNVVGRSSMLIIKDVGLDDIGTYFVRITRGRQAIESLPVRLEISGDGACGQQVIGGVTEDKLFDLLEVTRLRLPFGGLRDGRDLLAAGLPPVLGYVGSRDFTLEGTRDRGEPNHCGVAGGASRWLDYTAPSSGTVHLNTDGSDFDTILAVYLGTATDYSNLVEVACDNNNGLDGLDSKLQFDTEAGVSYFIVVDGVAGAKGTVKLNYALLTPLVLTNSVKVAPTINDFRVDTSTSSYPFSIEYSTDLVNWTWMLTTQAISGSHFDFRDAPVSPSENRYYRAYQVP